MIVRPFTAADLPAYRTARLQALQQHPEAYSSAWEEERAYDDATFMARIVPAPPGAMLGAFANGTLCGMGGLVVASRVKQAHVGTIVGVYVDPRFRGSGAGRAVMLALIEAARTAKLLIVQLTVSVGNAPARRLYADLGFQSYGVARRALRVGDRFIDDEFMSLDLD